MNAGPGRPSGGGGRNRRRRGRRPRGANPGGRPGRDQQHSGVYSAPMDHSYRAALAGGNNGSRIRMRPGFSQNYPQPDPDPLPVREDANSRIFGFVDDLFFQAKIQETARKLNVKVEFVKSESELGDRIKQNGEEKPSLIIFDLNSNSVKPLSLIPKL